METFSALLSLCEGNSPVTGEFPSQKSVTRSFDVFFDLRLTNGWTNHRDAGDSRRHRAHYDITTMLQLITGGRMSCSQLMIEHQDSSLSNDHQDDTPYCTSSEKLTT